MVRVLNLVQPVFNGFSVAGDFLLNLVQLGCTKGVSVVGINTYFRFLKFTVIILFAIVTTASSFRADESLVSRPSASFYSALLEPFWRHFRNERLKLGILKITASNFSLMEMVNFLDHEVYIEET